MMIMLYDRTIKLKNTFTLGYKIKCISMLMCVGQHRRALMSKATINSFSIERHFAACTTDYQL